MNSRRDVRTSALRALAAGIFAALLTLLALTYIGTFSSFSLIEPDTKTSDANIERSSEDCEFSSKPTIKLVVQRLRPTEGIAEVDPSLCITYKNLMRLKRLSADGSSVFSLTNDGVKVKRMYRNLEVELEIQSFIPDRRYTLSLPLSELKIPVKNLVFGQGSPFGGVEVHLPHQDFALAGRASDFPRDSFSMNAWFRLYLPDLIVYDDDDRVETIFFPRSISVYSGPAMSQFRIATGTSQNVISPDGEFFGIDIERSGQVRLFVVALLAIPLVLVGCLASLLSGASRRVERLEIVIGATAVLLALFPIRAVLVPANLDVITLVDVALAVEIALLTLFSTWVSTRTHKEGSSSDRFFGPKASQTSARRNQAQSLGQAEDRQDPR